MDGSWNKKDHVLFAFFKFLWNKYLLFLCDIHNSKKYNIEAVVKFYRPVNSHDPDVWILNIIKPDWPCSIILQHLIQLIKFYPNVLCFISTWNCWWHNFFLNKLHSAVKLNNHKYAFIITTQTSCMAILKKNKIWFSR